ncbi:MAG: lipoprotein-releasing ABC transporter permease subunit [Pseudomonadota bacterium]
MFRPLEFYIGLRYTRAKRRNHFISFISLISILGVALGITVLITVLSVMNGFEKEVRERILGMASHVTISGSGGRLEHWNDLAAQVRDNPQVVGAAPYVQGQAMLVNGKQVSGALIRGVLPAAEPSVSDVGEHMLVGSVDELVPGRYNVVLGVGLAGVLGVGVGDKVIVVTPQATVTPAGILPKLRRFKITGIFEVGMSEYDNGIAVIHIDDASRLFQLDGQVSGLRLKLQDMFHAPLVSRQMMQTLGMAYWISDWTRQHANYFRAVKTEKTMMLIILMLIVGVAAFNIVSTLIMLVTDKRADIAILRTLGLTPAKVMIIFLVQGTIIGLLGTLLGVAGGVALALNVETLVPAIEGLLDTKFLSPDVYYISDLPSDVHLEDVIKIALAAFFITIIATLYPAWRAARTQPAEALRYE